jgi:hypothetical protein
MEKKFAEVIEWKSDLNRVRAFWFGSRGFRPKMMRGQPILGWPESPKKKKAAGKSVKKAERMAARY